MEKRLPGLDLDALRSFVTGMAISAVLTLAGHPILGLAAAFAGGLGAAVVTGLLHTRLKSNRSGRHSDNDGAVFRQPENHGGQTKFIII